jgi:hypothetical protein
VINQTVGPGNTGDILYFTRVLMFISFLSLGYTLSRPKPAGNKEPYLLLSNTTEPLAQELEWAGLPPWQRKVSEKAVQSYADAQEKKWHRWNEAMFERSV